MRVVILRGGRGRRARRPGPARAAHAPGTRERGVLAIGNDQGQWVLVNMSPAVAHQLDSDSALDQHGGLPNADVADVRAVLLTDAQVDHVGGLLSLRDGAPIDLYATPAVFESLTAALPVLPVLQHYCGVHWRVVPVAGDRRVASFRVEGMPTLEFTAVATTQPAPPHLAQIGLPQVGDSVGLAVRDLVSGQRLFCAPGAARLGETELAWMREADCLLLDGPPATEAAATEAGGAAARAPGGALHPADAAAPPTDGTHPAPELTADPVANPLADPLADWLRLLQAMPAQHKVLLAPPSGLDAAAELRLDPAEHGLVMAYDGMEIAL